MVLGDANPNGRCHEGVAESLCDRETEPGAVFGIDKERKVRPMLLYRTTRDDDG
jgi:hypothetical protein